MKNRGEGGDSMLIGVELPITEDNVKRIDGFQLMKAYEMFLVRAID